MRSSHNPNQLSLELFFVPEKKESKVEVQQAEMVLPEVKVLEVEETINRDEVFDSYKPLGLTVKLDNDRGLSDMHRRRAANFQQFFTPFPIVKFLTKALALDISENLIVLDNSCGIGGMFRYLPLSTRIKGIEFEKKAYETAIKLFPNANIINDNLIHHIGDVENSVDVALINPPFSIHIEKENLSLDNAQWGVLGPGSSIQSHIAAVEIALRSARFVGAMLPEGFFKNESTRVAERWINQRACQLLRIDIPGHLFKECGFEWPCSIVLWEAGNRMMAESKSFSISRWEDLEAILREWTETPHYQRIREWIRHKAKVPSQDFTLEVWKEKKARKQKQPYPVTEQDEVKLCLSPNGSSVILKPNGLLAALKVQEYKDDFGEVYNHATKRYVKGWFRESRSSALLEQNKLHQFVDDLISLGMKASVDPQLAHWIQRKQKWLKRQQTPNEQWIQKNGEWKELHSEDGIRAMYPEIYRQQERKLENLGVDWLWDFQKDDVVRMSMKQHNLLVANMGLGKTRQIIALGLLYGCKHNLIILESRNIKEFETEFRNLGITDYLVIEDRIHLKHLKKFNLVAYSRIWRAVDESKTFAKALRKRFGFIACDEAHNLKAAKSNQALAVRSLKAKHWLLSTGTPIANYPRNIFSLLVTAYGDGTALNPYGYYTPYFNNYGVTSGTRQFKENFVTVEWITPQFEQTLDTGRKSREFPKIKDVEKWQAMLAPKMLRRQNDEPEVVKSVRMPKAELKTMMIKPDVNHLEFYKKWLDEFASWFREQLEKEKEEGHKFDQVMLLVQLGKLQFVSTIPQSVRLQGVNRYEWKEGLTEKQKETIRLARDAVVGGEKVIVYSERPELCNLLRREFERIGIDARLFTGEQPIPVRNASLEDFKFNGIPVLLATTTCGETGLNIPQASTVIMTDTSWTPSKQRQAYSRILRPQQKKQPKVFLLRNKGTIDEYMQQLMDVKQDAIENGIDHQESSFNPEEWLSYRDFSYKMLREEGLI